METKTLNPNVASLINYFKKKSATKLIPAHSNKIHTIAWNAKGNLLATGSCDKNVCIFTFDKDRLEYKNTLRGHSSSVDQLVWHPTDANILVSASMDKSIKIWDTKTQCCQTVSTKGENINIAWSPDGKIIAVGSNDDLITFIDVEKLTIIDEQQFKFEVNEITWDTSGKSFAVTSGEGSIHLFDYSNGKFDISKENILRGHSVNCICLKYSNDGKYFACGSADASISIWSTKDLICGNVINRLQWPVRSICFSHDSKLVASASEDNGIDVAYVKDGSHVHLIKAVGSTFSVAWHPSKYLLVFSSESKLDRENDSLHLFGYEP